MSFGKECSKSFFFMPSLAKTKLFFPSGYFFVSKKTFHFCHGEKTFGGKKIEKSSVNLSREKLTNNEAESQLYDDCITYPSRSSKHHFLELIFHLHSRHESFTQTLEMLKKSRLERELRSLKGANKASSEKEKIPIV